MNKKYNINLDNILESKYITKEELRSLNALYDILKKININEEIMFKFEKSYFFNCLFKTIDNKWIVKNSLNNIKIYNNVDDACIECLSNYIKINIYNIANIFLLKLSEKKSNNELLDFANKMNYLIVNTLNDKVKHK